MLTEFARRKDFFECLTYFMVDIRKDVAELASEVVMDDGNVVGMGLCLEAKGIFDLKNLCRSSCYVLREDRGVKGKKVVHTSLIA